MTMNDLERLQVEEIQRERWGRAMHGVLRDVDPLSQSFATGGLDPVMPDPAIRILVLPPDPDLETLAIDEPFVAWWKSAKKFPFWDQEARTANESRLISTGVQYAVPDYRREHENELAHRLRLDRNGVLEAAWSWHSGVAFARDHAPPEILLVGLVGRLWTLLDRYRDVIDRGELAGPFLLVICIRGAIECQLADLAAGWRDPAPQSCVEPNLRIRIRRDAWTAETPQELAFTAGARIEAAWNSTELRFLARDGDQVGKFDVRAFSRIADQP